MQKNICRGLGFSGLFWGLLGSVLVFFGFYLLSWGRLGLSCESVGGLGAFWGCREFFRIRLGISLGFISIFWDVFHSFEDLFGFLGLSWGVLGFLELLWGFRGLHRRSEWDQEGHEKARSNRRIDY